MESIIMIGLKAPRVYDHNHSHFALCAGNLSDVVRKLFKNFKIITVYYHSSIFVNDRKSLVQSNPTNNVNNAFYTP